MPKDTGRARTRDVFDPEKLVVIVDNLFATRKEFAVAMGVSDVTVYQWINGGRRPTLEKLERLTEVTRHAVGDFFTRRAA